MTQHGLLPEVEGLADAGQVTSVEVAAVSAADEHKSATRDQAHSTAGDSETQAVFAPLGCTA